MTRPGTSQQPAIDHDKPKRYPILMRLATFVGMASPHRPNPHAAIGLCAGIVILLGYFAFYLPWHDGQQPVSEREMQEFGQQLSSTSSQLQSMLNERLSVKQLSAEQERQDTDLGQALALRCAQWTEVHASRPTDDSERYQEWACKRYNHYITRGEILPDEPPE